MDIISNVVIFWIVVEYVQSVLIDKSGWKRVKTADNNKPEVAQREGTMKTQLSSP